MSSLLVREVDRGARIRLRFTLVLRANDYFATALERRVKESEELERAGVLS